MKWITIESETDKGGRAMDKEKRPARRGRKHVSVTALLTAAVLLVLPLWTAVKAQAVDLTKACSLQVEQDDHGEGPERPDLTVDLYRVAGAENTQEDDAYTLSAENDYADLQEKLNRAMGKETKEQAAEAYRQLAQEVLKKALGIEGEPEKGETVQTAGALSYADSINLKDTDTFTDLEPGMYLMVVRGTDLMNVPDYVTVLEGGELATAAYAGGFLYLYSPELIALPQWESAGEGEGRWNGSVTAALKSCRSEEYVSLLIRKKVSGTQGGVRPTGEDHFVYRIEAMFGKKKVYSNVVMLTMAEDKSEEELVLPKIVPAGAAITVTEVYAGASHEPDGEKEVVIAYARADAEGGRPVNVAAFANRYTGTDIAGGAIENRFRYETGTGKDGWKWEPYPGKAVRP